jgi:hypothetical protein
LDPFWVTQGTWGRVRINTKKQKKLVDENVDGGRKKEENNASQ